MEDPCRGAPADSLVYFENNPKHVCCPDREGQPQTLPAGSGNLVIVPDRPYIFRYSQTNGGTSPFVLEIDGQMFNGAFSSSPGGKSPSLAVMFRSDLGDLAFSGAALSEKTTDGLPQRVAPLPENPVSLPYRSSRQVTFQTARCSPVPR